MAKTWKHLLFLEPGHDSEKREKRVFEENCTENVAGEIGPKSDRDSDDMEIMSAVPRFSLKMDHVKTTENANIAKNTQKTLPERTEEKHYAPSRESRENEEFAVSPRASL